jgi:metallo-beta-lactamase class B
MKSKFMFFAVFFLLFASPLSVASSKDTIRIASDLQLVRINENAWIHISSMKGPRWPGAACNGLIFIDKNQAYMLDTPPDSNTTGLLIDYVQNRMKAQMQGVIVHHWHSDCMGGLSEVHKRGIKSYASKLTCQIAQSKNLPVPKYSFENSLTLKLGRKDIICRYFGEAHTPDNIVTWIPNEKILFAGCMVKDLQSTSLGNISDANVAAWPATLRKLRNEYSDAEFVIPGHGPCGGTDIIEHTRDLLAKHNEYTN